MQVENKNSVYYSNNWASLSDYTLAKNKLARADKRRLRVAAKSLPNSVAFKSSGRATVERFWMQFGKLSDYMKEPSEMVSAIIQAIGTSVVAPIAILSSPNRHVHNEEERKAAKEKKRFQAYRQPFSALIALGFQVPATMGIAKAFDHYAYEKPVKLFKDNTIGNLIPNKKYLAGQAKKALKENADSKLLTEWASELEYARNTEKVKQDYINSIKEKYKKFGIELSDEKLEKMANNKKKVTKFIADKMASKKHDTLLNAKIEELRGKNFDIKNIDLITGEDKDFAKAKFSKEFKALEKEKLNWFDKIIKVMGFSNGRIKAYNEAAEKLAQEKGLNLLREEKPEIFIANSPERFKQFLKNRDELATKTFKNKKFWIQLVTNLAMVAISCTVLNWMHPKFMDFLDGMKQAKKEEEQRKQSHKKVEVRA